VITSLFPWKLLKTGTTDKFLCSSTPCSFKICKIC
jgi:hypothetical protein